MKELLVQKVITYLRQELSILLAAAENAHLAAIDEQSVAETQYDTLAIEASYLAEGQSRRVLELRQSIELFQKLIIKENFQTISLGALVKLAQDEENSHWFFIAPAAAGFKTNIENRKVTLVTPNAPMGKALLGKEVDDDIEVKLATQYLTDSIIGIE